MFSENLSFYFCKPGTAVCANFTGHSSSFLEFYHSPQKHLAAVKVKWPVLLLLLLQLPLLYCTTTGQKIYRKQFFVVNKLELIQVSR